MKWIISNIERPTKDGMYYAKDSNGNEYYCFFIKDHWHPTKNYPIIKWDKPKNYTNP